VTRLAGVLGWPLEHTRSPALHNAAYAAAGVDAVYVALPVPPERLAAAVAGLAALGFLGANVTVPHKAAALALCDRLDPVARRAGAVNTLVVEAGGALAGHNTDVAGFRDALDEAAPGLAAAGGPAVVLGAGGAARAVLLALADGGMTVRAVARQPERAEGLRRLGAAVLPWTGRGLAEALAGAALLVDATSAALDPAGEAALPAPVPLERLAAGAVVASLVYHREPALLAAARARGFAVLDGGPMLVHQAARAFTLMTGAPAPLAAMRAALRR
jgi:shikimate dehydrogenase